MKTTILIIEDNKDIREGTAEILELSGYKVLQAENGRTGVDEAVKHKPGLILCDIMMPELDGFGVLYLLSKSPETESIPFIFLTAKTDRLDFRKAMEMGADDFLTKPFDGVELLRAIEGRLKKKDMQEAHYSKSLKNLEGLSAGSLKGTAELKSLIAARKMRHIKKRQTLYYEGDLPQGIYLVLEGCIKTVKLARDGRELMTGLYQPDDYLGVNALLSEKPYTEAAEALEDAAVCLLPREMVMNLLNKYPDIGQQFIKMLSSNIQEKEEQLLDLAYNSVRKRLAQVLVRLTGQLGNSADIKMSRNELATMAGIATETVSRTLTEFKDEGLIERNGTGIRILKLDSLIKMKN